MPNKICSSKALARKLSALRARGKKVAFTNGCFDLLHYGHVRYLERARALADVLVVALNTDKSVRRLKGVGRPLTPLADRQRLLASLECVDFVTAFPEATPAALIERLKPDVLIKGGDYKGHEVAGGGLVKSRGGRVVIMPFLKGRSTSRLIHKIRAGGAG